MCIQYNLNKFHEVNNHFIRGFFNSLSINTKFIK